MKFDYNKLKWIRSALILGVLALCGAQAAVAGSYNSSVILPTVHSKGYMYKIEVPVTGAPLAGALISDVYWTWSVVGWPRALQVNLCMGNDYCLDVSRQRSGSTRFFAGRAANQRLYFAVRVGQSGVVPVAGQQARVGVSW